MKKKITLLSLISALTIGASLAFTACGDDTVGEHDHVWDEGTVTTESTCFKEGVRTYNCTVDGCKQTKTAPIAMIAHSWNDGEITKEATCSEEGEKTYTCTVEGCGKTKPETIGKTDHDYDDGKITKTPDFLTKGIKTSTCSVCDDKKNESVEAHADFSEQFYTSLTDENNWLYGYATSFDVHTGAVDFVRIEQTESDKWKSEKTEIGNGYVYSENNAVIAYKFNGEVPQRIQTDVAVSFIGEESTTRLNAYLIITDNDGALKESFELNDKNGKDWTFNNENAFDVAQGDTFYLVFDNNGAGKAGGSLSFTLTAPCVHVWSDGKVTKEATCTAEGIIEYTCVSCDKKMTESIEMTDHEYDGGRVTVEPTATHDGEMTYTCLHCDHTKTESIPKRGNGADFRYDFTLENQDGAWGYGKMDDPWGADRHFVACTEKTSEAWTANDGGVEIKAGWINASSETTIAYTAEKAVTAKVKAEFEGSQENTLLAIRIYAVGEDGKLVEKGFNSSKNDDGKQVVEIDYDFKAGETIYVMFSNEHWDGSVWQNAAPNGNLDISVTEVKAEPVFEEVSFREDFVLENQDGAWGYGYMADPWGADRHFVASTEKTSEAWTANGGGVEIKAGWINASSETTIAYTSEKAVSSKVKVEFTGSQEKTLLAIRIYAVGEDGKLVEKGFNSSKNDDGKQVVEIDYDFKAGETIYIMFSNEHWDGSVWQNAAPNGDLDITVITENGVSAPEFNGADFREDFALENQDGAWGYGKMDDPWGTDRHFVASTEKTSEAWTANDGGVEIKAGWINASSETTIAYTAEKAVTAKVKAEFEGSQENTLLAIRIYAVGEDGKLVEKGFNSSKNDDGKQVVEINYDFKAGETIYVMFSNEHWDGSVWQNAAPNGDLDITLVKV